MARYRGLVGGTPAVERSRGAMSFIVFLMFAAYLWLRAGWRGRLDPAAAEAP